MALQCSYVCMCHMCSHMCGHMGSCVLDILQGIGIAGAGTVSQVRSRMPNNPLLCNYGLLKKSNIHPEEFNSFHAFQLFSLQHWPRCDCKLMNSVLLALSPVTFHSTEFNICLLNGSQSQYTDSVWAARGERFLSPRFFWKRLSLKKQSWIFYKKTKILMPPPRRLKRRHLSYKTGSFSFLLWCGLLFCGHLERWLRTGDGVTKLCHCCVFFGLHLKTGTALDQVCLPAWNFRAVPTPNLFLSSEPPFLHLSHWSTSRKTKDPEMTYTPLFPPLHNPLYLRFRTSQRREGSGCAETCNYP